MLKTILTLAALASISIAVQAEQFSLTNATHQSRLDKDFWEQIDAWPKGEMTNGLFCAARILRQSIELHYHPLSVPICCVYVANTTTNSYHFLSLPDEATMLVSLFDTSGKQVSKIDEREKISVWTQDKIGDWFEEHNHTHGVAFWVAPLFYVGTKVFSIPETFQIKEAGEYTLHLRVRLVKTSGGDSAGKVYFQSLWLPEVITKVQIRPEDIPREKTPSSAATNLPSK